MDVPHGIRCARRADRARFIPAARDVPPRTHLRAARHEGHRVQCARDEDRPAGHQLPGGFPSAGGGLVSTIDDYLAFGQMMLSLGKHGNERLLSRPSVEAMTSDQLTPGQKAASGLIRSEEHTSELQSRGHLVCRLLLEKKKAIHDAV